MEKTLVIMAAGMGSRYGGLKQIDRIGPRGEVIMDFSVFDARMAGFTKVVFIIKRENEALFREAVGNRISAVMDTAYAYQELDSLPAGFAVPEGRVKPWGTGHAVMSCAHLVNGPFAVINADDFYGRDAFMQLSRWIDETDFSQSPPEYGMAGYLLKNTLTENGHVARGVCETDEAGFLTDINERTKILPREGGIYYTENDADWVPLPEDSVVSMNCWCFPPSFMGELKSRFTAFLEENRGNPDKAEFFLPFAVKDMLRDGLCRVRVLETGAKWFGVTYRADRENVAAALLEMVRAGEYPEGLWEGGRP